MSNIRSWSQTANSNNSASPNGWPEGMPPSGVNNTGRENMASVRTFADELPYYDSGDTPSRASASTFKVTTDVTARYVKGRRIKCNDGSTLYGTITASTYSAPDTTITVGLDSGSLTASLSSVALAILSPTSTALPHGVNLKGADIASASTTDLSAATGDYVDVTGTTTITALGTAANGVEKCVTFTGILTLTHNATSLILPGGANITTAAGDSAVFKSRGSGNWQCITYSKASGQAVVAPASNPFSDASGIVKNSSDGTKIVKISAASLTTGTTRTWTAPDYDLSNWVVQRLSSQTGALATGSTTIPSDDTIPQNTEGNQYLTLSITPKNTANILKIEVTLAITNSASGSMTAALFQDSTANALAGQQSDVTAGGALINMKFTHTMAAGTTSSTTFNVRAGLQLAGTTTFNGQSGARKLGGVSASSIVITEYAA
jgi:hypothetical protein